MVTLGSAGLMNELHSCFSRGSACFTAIASITGANHVIPGMLALPVAGDDMVQGEFLILSTTILTDVTIPVEHFCPGEFGRKIGAFNEVMQPDH